MLLNHQDLKILDIQDKFYKVVNGIYGLHQAPSARVYVDDILFGSTKQGVMVTSYNRQEDGYLSVKTKYVADILKKFNYSDIEVGDEAIHKELGDRMERAATTASSLEAEQDSCPKFAETHNVVAFLEKPEESDGFAEIIDFLKASSVSYALTIQALVDKKRVIVTESSIRRDLHLDDAEGTDCLPTATIFEELARMGFSSSMASLIICLATNQKFNLSKYIFDAMVKHLDGGVKFLLMEEVHSDEAVRAEREFVQPPSNDPQPSGEDSMKLTDLMVLCTKLQTQRFRRRKIARPTGVKRLRKVCNEDIDADVDVSLVDETQERQDDDLIFDTGVLDDVEMPVEAKVDGKDEQSTKKLDDSTAGEAVTTAGDDSAVPTTNEEITLAQTLIQIKAAKPKVVTTAATTTTTTRPKDKGVVVQEPSEFRVPQEIKPSSSKDKGKGIMIEPEVPLKRKDQIALDEQIARDIQAKLDAELLEEQKLARKQEEEANIALIESWENTQAMMEADRLLAERLQSKERDGIDRWRKKKTISELWRKQEESILLLQGTRKEKLDLPTNSTKRELNMSSFLSTWGIIHTNKLKGKSLMKFQNDCLIRNDRGNYVYSLEGFLMVQEMSMKRRKKVERRTNKVIIDYKASIKRDVSNLELLRADGSSKSTLQ
ncbi:hypothetical protein Tco_1576734 [Tanacetum coccineum]